MPLAIDRTAKVAANLVCLGLLLFLLGLLLGFVLIPMAGAKAILSAHQAALGSGAFLMALGLVWRTYMRSARSWLAAGLWISHYLLVAGLALGAPAFAQKALSDVLVLVSCLVMVIATLVALVALLADIRSNQGDAGEA